MVEVGKVKPSVVVRLADLTVDNDGVNSPFVIGSASIVLWLHDGPENTSGSHLSMDKSKTRHSIGLEDSRENR